MGFIDRIFGTELGLPARAIVALGLVLALIMLTVWLMRRFGSGGIASGATGRNRQQRLSVLDSAPVDARRRLVLIRRDNLEHLLLIGGPTDVVVESNIVRGALPSAPSRIQAPSRSGVFDLSDPEQSESPLSPSYGEPAYEEPARPTASPAPAPIPFRPVQEAPRQPAPPAPPSAQPMAAPMPPMQPRAAPAPRLNEPPQYADMAKRLEEALRKPGDEMPLRAPMNSAPRAPEPMRAPEPRHDMRQETRQEMRQEMRQEVRAPEPRVFAPQQPGRAPSPRAPEPLRSAPQQQAPAPQQSAADIFGSLEDEMASLLRPGGKNSQ